MLLRESIATSRDLHVIGRSASTLLHGLPDRPRPGNLECSNMRVA